MRQDDLIVLIKQKQLAQVYKHVAECTDYFKFEQLDSIISALDTKEQMDDFCQVAIDGFNLMMNTPSQMAHIQIINEYGTPVGFLYNGEISEIVCGLTLQALKRKEIEAKYESASTEVHPETYNLIYRVTDHLDRIQLHSFQYEPRYKVVVERIKANMKENLAMFVNEDDLVSFVLKLNPLLAGTGWDLVSSSVLKEMREYYNNKKSGDKVSVTVQNGAYFQITEGSINN